MANIIALDIESSNLNANFGFILCIGYKRIGSGPVRMISIAESPTYDVKPTDDKWVVSQIRPVIEQADAIVTHYGKRFDIPFINSRLLRHGLPVVPPRLNHIDTWEVAKKKMALNSNRLASVAGFLGCGEKTAVLGQQWIDAQAGDKKALKYVIDHCKQDILVLERAYMKLRPLMTNHPSVAVMEGKKGLHCPNCGSDRLQKRGPQAAGGGSRRQRYHCQDCGTWSHGPAKRDKEIEALVA